MNSIVGQLTSIERDESFKYETSLFRWEDDVYKQPSWHFKAFIHALPAYPCGFHFTVTARQEDVAHAVLEALITMTATHMTRCHLLTVTQTMTCHLSSWWIDGDSRHMGRIVLSQVCILNR